MYLNVYFDVGLGVNYTGAHGVAVVAERREPARHRARDRNRRPVRPRRDASPDGTVISVN